MPKSEPRYIELNSLPGVAALIVLHRLRLTWSFGLEPCPLRLANPISSGYKEMMLFILFVGFMLSIPSCVGGDSLTTSICCADPCASMHPTWLPRDLRS